VAECTRGPPPSHFIFPSESESGSEVAAMTVEQPGEDDDDDDDDRQDDDDDLDK